jgi:hypothetical protein
MIRKKKLRPSPVGRVVQVKPGLTIVETKGRSDEEVIAEYNAKVAAKEARSGWGQSCNKRGQV